MLRILRITFQSIVIFVQNDEHGTLDLSLVIDIIRIDNHRIGVFLFEKTGGPRAGEAAVGIAQRTTRIFLTISLGGLPTCYFIDGKNSSE